MVISSDNAGNSTIDMRSITHDQTHPLFSLNPVTTPTHQATQVLSGWKETGALVTVSCPSASAGTVTYPTEMTWAATLSNLSTGNNFITLRAVDLAGNESTLNTIITFSPAMPGDINDDQSVDLLDAIIALRLSSGMPVNANVAITRDADVNGDGKIGLQDIVYILQWVAGMR